jgi:hypothetical protein
MDVTVEISLDSQVLAGRGPIWLARYSPGVMLVASRKAREKFDCEEKPVDNGMSETDR